MISPRTQTELLASLCFLTAAPLIVGKLRPRLSNWRLALVTGFLGVIGLTQTITPLSWLPQALLAIALVSTILHLRTPGSARWPLAGVLIACLLVAFFSGENGAGGSFRAYLVSLGLSSDTASIVTLVLRKGVHLSFYGSVGALLYLACTQRHRTQLESVVRSLSFAVCLASFDEFRQTLAAGRGGALSDVGVDLTGAVFGLLIARLGTTSRRKPTTPANS